MPPLFQGSAAACDGSPGGREQKKMRAAILGARMCGSPERSLKAGRPDRTVVGWVGARQGSP